ncbi:MAG: 50S ribosomal protein L13 [Abitibacteriaceae bacterium]|nr:50S ribosomal protein L13 [Abditibacteriaceae bacterium]MBV9865944.1 50S ribosomal protein L13 [Abditibacteriaceae bacterium]
MASIQTKTYHAKPADIERSWYIVDATGQTVGRLASRVAHVLRGKHKPQFTPSIDTGDFVVIVNADKAIFTGNKLEQKIYYRASIRPGNLKRMDAKTMLVKHPVRVLEEAVTGMLPHNTLGRAQARKLHVYAGAEHPHAAQRPQSLNVETLQVG